MILYRTQLIKNDIKTVWEFFSNPRNLKIITPEYMGFDIINHIPDEMYEGLIIEYKVAPLFNIPIKWVSEITHIEKYKYFIDEQKVGPYQLWHHTHRFTQKDDGVLMEDIVYYEIPFFIIGKIFAPIVINRLNEIFDYRKNKIEEIFNQNYSKI